MKGLLPFSPFKRQRKAGAPAFLFVGLGNPGREYEQNRHNIGFMVVDGLRRKFSFPEFKKKFQGLLSEGTLNGHKMVLLKPQTFMNLSGQSVAAAAKFYKIAPERIFVFHDEVDIEGGDVRIKKGGGNAGHNGLKSIQQHLGTPDFWRVRIGVGRPAHGDVSDHVLGNFSKTESWKDAVLDKIAEHAGLLMEDPKAAAQKITEQQKG